MGRSCVQGVWPAIRSGFTETMEITDRTPKFTRISSDFIEREKSIIDVQGCVLKSFCHEWACELLKPHHERECSVFFFPWRIISEPQEKNPLDEAEFFGKTRIALNCLVYSLLDVEAIRFTRNLMTYVGSINRELSHQLYHCSPEAVDGDIAAMPVCPCRDL